MYTVHSQSSCPRVLHVVSAGANALCVSGNIYDHVAFFVPVSPINVDSWTFCGFIPGLEGLDVHLFNVLC